MNRKPFIGLIAALLIGGVTAGIATDKAVAGSSGPATSPGTPTGNATVLPPTAAKQAAVGFSTASNVAYLESQLQSQGVAVSVDGSTVNHLALASVISRQQMQAVASGDSTAATVTQNNPHFEQVAVAQTVLQQMLWAYAQQHDLVASSDAATAVLQQQYQTWVNRGSPAITGLDGVPVSKDTYLSPTAIQIEVTWESIQAAKTDIAGPFDQNNPGSQLSALRTWMQNTLPSTNIQINGIPVTPAELPALLVSP